VKAFKEYSKYTELEIERRWRHLCQLPPHQAALLPSDSLAPKMDRLYQAVAQNQLFFDALVSYVWEIVKPQDILLTTRIGKMWSAPYPKKPHVRIGAFCKINPR